MTTATTSTSPASSPPTSWCSSPTPVSAPSTRCASRRAALDGFPVVVALNRYTAGDLETRNREHLVDVDGAEVVTEPRQLATLLRLHS